MAVLIKAMGNPARGLLREKENGKGVSHGRVRRVGQNVNTRADQSVAGVSIWD